MRQLNCARLFGHHSDDTVTMFSGRSKPETYEPWPYTLCGRHAAYLQPSDFPQLTTEPEAV